jgi:ABC-type bacteriocin/lantibiotic exporter with double-glycine peptidase domain
MGKSEMKSPAPAQLLDSGLCGLSLVAGYYRIAGDPMQLKHQLALTGRGAQAEDIVRGANVLRLKSRILRGVTAKRLCSIPYPAILQISRIACVDVDHSHRHNSAIYTTNPTISLWSNPQPHVVRGTVAGVPLGA